MHFISGVFVLHTGKKTFWIGNWFDRKIHIFFKIANKQIFSFDLFPIPSWNSQLQKSFFFFLGWCISRPLNEITAKYWRWFSSQNFVIIFHPKISSRFRQYFSTQEFIKSPLSLVVTWRDCNNKEAKSNKVFNQEKAK